MVKIKDSSKIKKTNQNQLFKIRSNKIIKENDIFTFPNKENSELIQDINACVHINNNKKGLKNPEKNEEKKAHIKNDIENNEIKLNKIRKFNCNESCKFIMNKNKKNIWRKNNVFYSKLHYYLFFILFFISLLKINGEGIDNEYHIIKLTVNQSGYHNIFYKDINYIETVKINDLNKEHNSELGKYYFINEVNYVQLNLSREIKDLSYLFYSCSNITKIDFSEFSFSNIETMEGLFNGCTSLTSIKFGNTIYSKNVKKMSYMFKDCISLKSLYLSNFDVSNVTDMQSMFHNCSKLISLDLPNSDTSLLENMGGMFYGCIRLISLNLENFNTKNVTLMNKTFENCESLIMLNLSSFKIDKVTNMSYMFYGCTNLNFIDFVHLDLNQIPNINIYNIIDKASENLTILSESLESLKKIFSDYNQQIANYLTDFNDETDFDIFKESSPYFFSYIINSSKIFCTEKYRYKISPYVYTLNFQFNLKCEILYFFQASIFKCPQYFELIDSDSLLYCIPKCPKELPFLLIYKAKCISQCKISERINNECITIYKDDNDNDNLNYFDLIIEQIKEELMNNFDESSVNKKIANENDINIFLLKLNSDNTNFENKNLSLKLDEILKESFNIGNTYSYEKSSKRNLNELNNYIIHLDQCIEKLKQIDNSIDINELILLRTDVEQRGMQFPNFFYELYQHHSDKILQKIDLEECKDIKIDIDIHNANLGENMDIYKPYSDYYKDICYTTKSKYDTDITLSRRQFNYVDDNMAVCGLNCEFIFYNREEEKAVCSCDVKTEIPLLKNIRFDKNVLLNSFIEINNLMNLKMLKCYKTVFNKKNIIKNIGFYAFTILLILNIACMILFYYRDYKKLIGEIEKLNSNNNLISNELKNEKNKNNLIIKNILKTKNIRRKKGKKIKSSKQRYIFNSKSIKSKENLIKKFVTQNKDNISSHHNNKKAKISLIKNDKNKYNKKEKTYLNNSEFNSLKYNEALNQDKRSYTQYYLSLLQTNHSLVCVFYRHDYNSKIIKLSIFIFNLSSYIAINALFFNDSTMDKIYINHGSYIIIYEIPKIIYSSLISAGLNIIIRILGLSEADALKIKKEKEKNKNKNNNIKINEVIKNLKIKFVFFFIINIFLQSIFLILCNMLLWYIL